MKKLLYSVFALAGILTLSCTKEAESPVTPAEEVAKNTTTYTFKATLEDALTRTTYTDFQKFSWLAGDKIDVFTYNEEEETLRITGFEAQEDGVTTLFVGEVEDGYYPSNLAVYPDNAVFINSMESVYLPAYYIVDGETDEYYTVPSANPLQNLTLIGHVNEDQTAYAFKTAVGAVKFTFDNLPDGAKFLRIYAPEEKIAGYFYIDENDLLTNESAVPGTYTTSNGNTYDYSSNSLWYEFTPENGSATLYIPLPVGKLSAGTVFFIEDEDENVLYQRTTVKDIVVERNKVTEIAALNCQVSWKSLGTGKFVDNYNWYYTGRSNVGIYVDVEIQVDEFDPTHYRLVNPYTAAFTAFGYSAPRGTTKPSAYFDLYIDNNGYVYHPVICSGIQYSKTWGATYLISPADAYGENQGYNIVAKYQADGKTPANILLAPSYYWPQSGGYWTGNSYYYDADQIQIIFPGETEAVDLSCSATFVEIADDDVSQPVALATVDFGTSLSACNVIIAKDADAAKAALAAGNIGGTGTVSGEDVEVLFPANAESSDYYIFANPVPAEGLAPVVGTLLIGSETPFQYIRADAEDVTVEEILGTYTATDAYVLFNKPFWDAINAGEEDPEENEDDYDWYEGFTLSFTLEESDDEGLGQVMMTSFTEDAVDYVGIDTPIYGSFEPKTGAISFAPMQPIYSYTDDDGQLVEVMLATTNPKEAPLVFTLSLDKTTYTSQQFFGYVHYYTDEDQFGAPNIWFSPTNVPLELVKEGTAPAPAPARVPAAKPRITKAQRHFSAIRREFMQEKPLTLRK